MQPNINNMQTYYNNSVQPAATNFSGPVSNGAGLESNPLLKQAEKVDEGNTGILVGGVVGGTAGLMAASEFVNKALRRDYTDTFFNRIEQAGNNLGSKPGVSKFSAAISKYIDRIKNSSFVKNSEVLNTMMNKPGVAGPMGQPQAHSVRGYLITNALDALKNYSSMQASDLLKNYAKDPSKYAAQLDAVRNRLLYSPAQTQLLEKFIANPSANLSAVLAEFKLPDNRNLLIAYASEPDKYRNLVEALKYKQSKNPAVLKALDDFLANPTDKKLLKNILKNTEHLPVDKELSKLINLAQKDSYKYRKEIIQKIEDYIAKDPALKNKILHSNGGSMFMPKWMVPKFLREKVTFNEILNKYKLINNYKTLKSPLGAKISGGLFRSLEAMTNGMVGGKIGVLMQALFIGQSLKSAVDAPKGEKVSTFMEELVSMMAYTMTMGLQMRALNSVAGLKFLGMEEKDYKNYHRAVELAKKAAKAGDAKNYYKLKNIIKAYETRANGNLKFWQKPFKWLGKLVSVGRVKESVRPLKIKPKNAGQIPFTALRNTFAAIPHKLKTVGGFVGRAALIMAVISPIFSNWAVKLSHKVFGKPTNSILDGPKPEEEPKIEQVPVAPPAAGGQSGNLVDMMNNQYKNPSNAAPQPVTPQNPAASQAPAKPGNLVDMMNNRYKNPSNTAMNPQPAAQILQPAASQSITPAAAPQITRTYIPNPILGDEAVVDPALQAKYNEVNAAILKAEQAEMQVSNFLNTL